jgi:phage-related protein
MVQKEFYSKEINILRQSQQKMAFDIARSKGVNLSVMELQRMTDIFVELCLRPMDKDLKDRVQKLDKWLNDKEQESIEKIELDGILYK